MSKNYKILSLDGGGIKGVFTLGVLSQFENFLGKPINNYFDLVVGTSTGGIIALGLGKGFSANDLLEFYTKMGCDIFSGNRLLNALKHWGFSKYKNEILRKYLEEKFGETKLGESKIRLVIPSQNLDNGELNLFKTAHHNDFKNDYKLKMSEIALATSAAPSYFPVFKATNGLYLVDGGLYANNPIAIAAVEAVGILNWPSSNICILSIGCTHEAIDIQTAKKYSFGKGYWASNSLKLIMKGQSSAALGMAVHLTNRNVVRIDETVAKGKFSLDSISGIENLKGLGYDKGKKEFQNIKEKFFSESAKEFIPIHEL
ncbi:MAG: CBASS cGAMP-activated phospholipase [Ignavibacterium sp.]|jgi:patatin-like phospholipase/acyl hydrolase|nr:CBASS cGAMP-activated phospholipase [Ignavibacterium sp.]